MIVLPSAAGNAPNMARIAILAASLAYMNHTCCKYGKSCLTCCKFSSAVPAVPTWQRHSSNTKAIKEPQTTHTKKVAATKQLPLISWSQLPDLNW